MTNTTLSITLDVQQNTAHVAEAGGGSQADQAGHVTHQFTRRWECQILLLLWLEGQTGSALTSTALQQTLKQKGQIKELNRAQLQRLFASIREFLSGLPGQPLHLQTAPRKNTVGPWTLVVTAPVLLTTAGDGPQPKAASSTQPAWPYPLLLAEKPANQTKPDLTSVDTLHQLMTLLLTADANAVQGKYTEAIDTLQHIYPLALTAETTCLVCLREALWQKRLGFFDKARQLTRQVLANPPPLDPAQLNHARFLLQRIDYDEAPARAHAALWHSVTPLEAMPGADNRTLPEWHNLRALLARRRLLALPLGGEVSRESAPDNPATLHQNAINHFQSAIYWSLQQRDWDRLLAYVANIGFHLQSVLPLGLATVSQIFDWHCLCLTYDDKFQLQQDSGWEFIFLGGFWLDHHVELAARRMSAPWAYTVEDTHPSQQGFYLKALAKLKNCADPRQLVIMNILYARFVANHLPTQSAADLAAKAELAKTIQNDIEALLGSYPKLLQALQEEGYEAWLPAGPPSVTNKVKT